MPAFRATPTDSGVTQLISYFNKIENLLNQLSLASDRTTRVADTGLEARNQLMITDSRIVLLND